METGGPAFPQIDWYMTDHGPVATTDPKHPGMALRDYFAAAVASNCQITVNQAKDPPTDAEIDLAAVRIARTAYRIADALLVERRKERP